MSLRKEQPAPVASEYEGYLSSLSSPPGAPTLEVEDPADRTILARVRNGGAEEAVEAVEAAASAAQTWAGINPRTRSELLHGIYALMREKVDLLTRLIVAENGKSAADARFEVFYAAEFFRWFSEEAVRVSGDYASSPAGGVRTVVSRRPVGVCALVTPWNFPAAMATRKLAPALAAGCTAVLKPAAETPLTALAVARLMAEAGIPDGVVNVVPTTLPVPVVDAWLSDERVRKLSFTGSTAVGRELLAKASHRVLNVSMELGGNAPFVVFPDADVEAAVEGAMTAKFRGSGQACTAANRFYVHASVAPEFIQRFAARIADLRVARGTDPGTDVGPLISATAVENMRRLIEDALKMGAQVAAQAPLPALPGYFAAPTLLVDVPNEAEVVQNETFGPIAPVVLWEKQTDLIEMVNQCELGLAAYVYTSDLKTAMQFAESCEVGMVGINRGLVSDPAAPFGGVKQSGLGREGARDGIRDFQETQYFSIDWSSPSR